MADQTAVCVLGMHRSGTSVVMRLLNLLGVEVGPEEKLMPPTANNPRGYWESQAIADLDDDILGRLGGSWDAPPTLSASSFASPQLADLRRRARAILEADFADAELWGWKDPRTCLVLPFWQRLVPSLRYVICVRNPMDVARSLARSDGIEHGLSLWVRYLRDSLEYTLGRPRLLVFYEDVLDDWERELQRLGAFIGAEGSLNRVRRLAAKEGVVEEALSHHRTSVGDSLDDPRVGLPTKALYLALLLQRRLDGDVEPSLPYGALETFATAALAGTADPVRPLDDEAIPQAPMQTVVAELAESIRGLQAGGEPRKGS